MKLTVLGTGHATVVENYNTCFVLEHNNERMLVDAGGGNRILKQLELTNIKLESIHSMFVTHAHTDHVLGVVWIIRLISMKMLANKYHGYFKIFCHEELVDILMMFVSATLTKQMLSMIGTRIIFIPVKDGDSFNAIGATFTFFDILSTKMKQFGCTITYDDQKIAFCGDEPFNQNCLKYVEGCNWLLHEAFCLYRDRDIYQPYKKHHSTAKDAGELANNLQAPNLIVWHSEEDTRANKKELYTEEIRLAYTGNVYVPADLDVIELS